MDFPILFKGSNVWSVYVTESGDIVRSHGKKGGHTRKSCKRVTSGKNIGKSNETTVYQQAVTEAEGMFRNMVSQGYAEVPSDVVSFCPTLASKFDVKKTSFPCMLQPKLDGVRVVARVTNDGDVVLTSRAGREYLSKALDEIRKELSENFKGQTLDGELYTHLLSFDEISAACRRTKSVNSDTAAKLCYHVFDLVEPGDNFDARCRALVSAIDDSKMLRVKRVRTVKCKNMDDVQRYHDTFVEQGYEGVVVRKIADGGYTQNRTRNLQKLKNFDDDEFELVGVKEAQGVDKGTAIFVCKTKDGHTFSVRPHGSRDYRRSLLDYSKPVKVLVSVRFQGYTQNGVPRFPTRGVLRDYE